MHSRVKTLSCTSIILPALVILVQGLGGALSFAAEPSGANCSAFFQTFDSKLTLAAEVLRAGLAQRQAEVPEFKFIREEAERRGLRVWLFGGTAAGYAHHIKTILLKEAGDPRFAKSPVSYDYTDIFRSTQDLDIVVSGSAKEAEEFEKALRTQFPHFVGSKATPWEVRSLTEPRADKGALLDDFGFMNQHTDSHSTGMIELTKPQGKESVVRDLRDWKADGDSQFFKDVQEGRLTFYYSATHDQTQRFKDGKNPHLFAVIRALTKAFQYDLEISADTLALFKKTVVGFDPARDLQSADAQRWLEKNGKKLYQHAVSLEYASRVMDELGLKPKLAGIQNDASTQDSLAWWMNKSPLKSFPVGTGSGRTAKELGITTVAHETSDFLAYESITRSKGLEPNVFESRQDAVGEAAMHGDGFYTATGKKGARGTGITIRFDVDPNAREGVDFVLDGNPQGDGSYVVFKNKQAIRVIPETLEMSPSQYLEFLAEGKNIDSSDQALMWKLKRKLQLRFTSGRVEPEELKKIRQLVKAQIERHGPNHKLIVDEWLKMEGAQSGSDPKQVRELAESLTSRSYRADPGPAIDFLSALVRGTDLEKWVHETYIPALLADLRPDLGDRAIQNSLLSAHPEIRGLGFKALAVAEQRRPHSAWVKELRAMVTRWKGQASINFQAERQAMASWLNSDLKNRSVRPLFERLAKTPDERDTILSVARPESFQFVEFQMPPGGKKFIIGTPLSEDPAISREPLREVTLTRPFEMQATPVTQAQWASIMGKNPSYFIEDGVFVNGIQMNPNRPVEAITADEIQKFIEKLNQLDDLYIYRLPTEAEWEVAARAGNHKDAAYGGEAAEVSEYGWNKGNSEDRTHDVASLKPNPAGLYDMLGNVSESVQDWYTAYPEGGIDPTGPIGDHFKGKVTSRGGSYPEEADKLRPDRRDWKNANVRTSGDGFRLVRTRRQPRNLQHFQ